MGIRSDDLLEAERMDGAHEHTPTWFDAECVEPIPELPCTEIVIGDARDRLGTADVFEV